MATAPGFPELSERMNRPEQVAQISGPQACGSPGGWWSSSCTTRSRKEGRGGLGGTVFTSKPGFQLRGDGGEKGLNCVQPHWLGKDVAHLAYSLKKTHVQGEQDEEANLRYLKKTKMGEGCSWRARWQQLPQHLQPP